MLSWISNHKLLLFCLAAATAFCVSTIVLAVEKSDLQDQLQNLNNSKDPDPVNMDLYILPKHVKPLYYDLFLNPHLDSGLFDGTVKITIDVAEEDDTIYIHSNGLGINSVKFKNADCDFKLDKTHELIVVKLPEKQKGTVILTIKYYGDMKNRIVGLYQSTYTSKNNVKRAIATSKFEPTYARQAYPCFDEPNLKANFTVTLVRPNNDDYIALSNMPEESSELTEDGVAVKFKTSVKMSTYLSCFIVSDFKYKSTTIFPGADNIPLRVYSSPDNIEKTDFALNVGKTVIEYYLKYFNIPYPLPKLDLVAIPDFVSGAMEHWGLVTFRETALLFDNETSSTANQLRVATVVAHELAHSWFGNLVTMDWWNDLWLNEGFATYIEYKGIDYVFKDWQMAELFLIDELHNVLSLDATTASHPIVVNVKTPNQITEIFDTITYSKGASILRMLEDTVGDENFQTATTNYLNNHLFGNAVTQNYFDEVQKIVGNTMDINEFMNTYTEQFGFPIITITESGDNFVLTQKQFLKDTGSVKALRDSSFQYKWTIPVTYVTDQNPNNRILVWFKYNQNQITIPKPKGAKWVKFNHRQVGYYRVNYSSENWKILQNNYHSMATSDRIHLVEETFSIAQAGQLSYDIPLDFTKQLKSEESYFVWSVASTKFSSLHTYLADSPVKDRFKKYILDLIETIYSNNNNWEIKPNDSYLSKLIRSTIFGMALKVDHADSLKKVNEMFTQFLSNDTPIPADLRDLVYRYGIKNGSKADWDKLWQKFVDELDANEKIKLMGALAQSQDTTVLQELINRAKDETYVRSQDYFTLMSYISGNSVGTDLVWNYVRNNWEALVDRFTINERYLGRMIPQITKSFLTQARLNEMTEFFAKYPEAGAGEAARKEALENVKSNIAWMAKNKEVVENWIKANAPA